MLGSGIGSFHTIPLDSMASGYLFLRDRIDSIRTLSGIRTLMLSLTAGLVIKRFLWTGYGSISSFTKTIGIRESIDDRDCLPCSMMRGRLRFVNGKDECLIDIGIDLENHFVLVDAGSRYLDLLRKDYVGKPSGSFSNIHRPLSNDELKHLKDLDNVLLNNTNGEFEALFGLRSVTGVGILGKVLEFRYKGNGFESNERDIQDQLKLIMRHVRGGFDTVGILNGKGREMYRVKVARFFLDIAKILWARYGEILADRYREDSLVLDPEGILMDGDPLPSSGRYESYDKEGMIDNRMCHADTESFLGNVTDHSVSPILLERCNVTDAVPEAYSLGLNDTWIH